MLARMNRGPFNRLDKKLDPPSYKVNFRIRVVALP